MPLIPEEKLAEYVTHAKSWERQQNETGTASYQDPESIMAYVAEEIGQCLLVLNSPYTSPEGKAEIMDRLDFYAGIIGRVAEIQGAKHPATYNKFDTPKGNQVDRFLKEIGFKNEEVVK